MSKVNAGRAAPAFTAVMKRPLVVSWPAVALMIALLASALLGGCGGSVMPGFGPVPSYAEPDAAPLATAQRFGEVAAGEWHGCMRTDAGAAWCWGWNETGAVGRPIEAH